MIRVVCVSSQFALRLTMVTYTKTDKYFSFAHTLTAALSTNWTCHPIRRTSKTNATHISLPATISNHSKCQQIITHTQLVCYIIAVNDSSFSRTQFTTSKSVQGRESERGPNGRKFVNSMRKCLTYVTHAHNMNDGFYLTHPLLLYRPEYVSV